MLDFDYYVRRHGEAWVLDLVERLERYEGVRSPFGQPLEQRWAFLMQTAPKNQTLPRAA